MTIAIIVGGSTIFIMTTVTFSLSLAYGELEAGDFLMIGDERHEVLTTYPITDHVNHRPIKAGGVIDSVLVHTGFQAASQNVPCFRSGPAKGIKAALEALPGGVVSSVATENFNTGTLLGYHVGGVSTTTCDASGCAGLTTISNINSDYDNAVGAASFGEQRAKDAGHNGGLAPYDTIRIKGATGRSEFLQVRNVDLFSKDSTYLKILAKGKAAAQAGDGVAIVKTKTSSTVWVLENDGVAPIVGGYLYKSEAGAHEKRLITAVTAGNGDYSVTIASAFANDDWATYNAGTYFVATFDTSLTEPANGIGAGKQGAIYRAGGYHVRVTFNTNSGNLPEMVVGEEGLYSVFYREFTGTVKASSPRKVECALHGAGGFNAETTYPYPTANYGTGTTGNGADTTFAGDLANLKVMAGMRIKLGDQVRTVVADISGTSAPAFYVDQPFAKCSASATVDDVEYIFHKELVEQIYDESTYSMLTMSKAVYFGSQQTLTFDGDIDAGEHHIVTFNGQTGGAGRSYRFTGVNTLHNLGCNKEGANACVDGTGGWGDGSASTVAPKSGNIAVSGLTGRINAKTTVEQLFPLTSTWHCSFPRATCGTPANCPNKAFAVI
jgi:hypothetical protein